ncbi:MAG TPA: hypothetical protein VHY09_03820 [Candidatus Methylacidiphilales bacterium]|jgi:hypothetical protein|nr:hypothetical protein [Candidatus Methylacidiphilales bacterium]
MRLPKSWLVPALGLAAIASLQAKTALPVPTVELSGPSFPVGNLTFTVPARWEIEPVDGPARGGQWRVPPLHGQGDAGEVVAYFFGRGAGGSAEENIEAWIGTMFSPGGHPADKQWQYQAGGFKVSQVVIFGTYNQVVTSPGIPPVARPNYVLLGTVIDNPAGNIYWRFTGPEALVTAALPLFNKMIDSVKVHAAK